MDFFRSQLLIVCTMAFFMMAGVQSIHACVGMERAMAQTEERHSCPDQQECPIGHCSHTHSCMSEAMTENTAFLFIPSLSGSFAISDETCGDRFCKEIDHPPQLS